MITQKFRVENVVTENATMGTKVQSKEAVKQFTKLFIENIMYERKIVHSANYADHVYNGVTMKKLKDTDNRFAKHFATYYQGIEDAINKGYLKEVIVRFVRKDKPDETLEQYDIGYLYYPDDSPKLCEASLTTISLNMIMTNMRYCINRYFDPLPPVSEIDTYIYIKFYDEITPDNYVAPFFTETDSSNMKTNENHAVCSLGTFKTPFIKTKGRIEGYASNQSDHESSPERTNNGTPSIGDSQEEAIVILDDD